MLPKWMKSKLDGKKLKKDQLLILFLAGILLLIIAIPTGEKRREEESVSRSSEAGEQEIENDYAAVMEERLADLLAEIEGAGQVTVMITLRSSAERIVEKDRETQDETVTEEDSQGGTRSTKSQVYHETAVYDDGDGDVQSPYISKEISPRVEGVVVVASGGDDAVVVKNITEAVQALFGIDTHKIRIMKGRRAKQ